MAKHILIIGGGIIGLSCAYHCARQGFRVTILERDPAQRNGCSFGNAGLIVPSHFIPLAAPGMVSLGLKWMWNPESPFYIKPRLSWDLWSWCWRFWRSANAGHVERSAPLLRDLHLASRACYEEWAEQSHNAFGLEKRGLLLLCKTAHGLEEEAKAAEHADRLGIRVEVLDATLAAALEPSLRMNVVGAVYYPQDCQLSPNRLMSWLGQDVEEQGVQVHWQTEVLGWRIEHQRIEMVHTTQGDFRADEYVLCGGSWSSAIARDLQLRLPMQAGKGYSLTLPNPPRLPRIAAILTEARVAVTPMGSSLRFGGTMEIAGLHQTIDPRRVQGIIKSAVSYFPDFTPSDFANIEPWCGLRPCSPDGLPYLGRSSRYENLTIATGHAMLGVSLGPITGRLVAEILQGGKPMIDIAALSPDRHG
jgi:D-amino-acid dehydrogenase